MIHKKTLGLFAKAVVLLMLCNIDITRANDTSALGQDDGKGEFNMQLDSVGSYEDYDHSVPKVITTATKITEDYVYPSGKGTVEDHDEIEQLTEEIIGPERLDDEVDGKHSEEEPHSTTTTQYETDNEYTPKQRTEDKHALHNLNSKEKNDSQNNSDVRSNDNTTNDTPFESESSTKDNDLARELHTDDDIEENYLNDGQVNSGNYKLDHSPGKIYSKLIKRDEAADHLPNEHVEGDKTFPDNPLITHNKKYSNGGNHFSNEEEDDDDDGCSLDNNRNKSKKLDTCESTCSDPIVEIEANNDCPVVESINKCGASRRGLKSKSKSKKNRSKRSKNKTAKSKRKSKSKSKRRHNRKSKSKRGKKSTSRVDNNSEKNEAEDVLDEVREAKNRANEAEIAAKKARADADEAQQRAEAKGKRLKAELETKKKQIDNDENELDNEISAETDEGAKSKSKGSKNKRKHKKRKSETDFDLPKCRK